VQVRGTTENRGGTEKGKKAIPGGKESTRRTITPGGGRQGGQGSLQTKKKNSAGKRLGQTKAAKARSLTKKKKKSGVKGGGLCDKQGKKK